MKNEASEIETLLSKGEEVIQDGLPGLSLKSTAQLLGLANVIQLKARTSKKLLSAALLSRLSDVRLKSYQAWLDAEIPDVLPGMIKARAALENIIASRTSTKSKDNLLKFLVDGEPLKDFGFNSSEKVNFLEALRTTVTNYTLMQSPTLFKESLSDLQKRLKHTNAETLASLLLTASPKYVSQALNGESQQSIIDICMIQIASRLPAKDLEEIELIYVNLLDGIETIRTKYGVEIFNIGKMMSDSCEHTIAHKFFDQSICVIAPPGLSEIVKLNHWLIALFKRPLAEIKAEFLSRGCGKILSLSDLDEIKRLKEQGYNFSQIFKDLKVEGNVSVFHRACTSRIAKYKYTKYWSNEKCLLN